MEVTGDGLLEFRLEGPHEYLVATRCPGEPAMIRSSIGRHTNHSSMHRVVLNRCCGVWGIASLQGAALSSICTDYVRRYRNCDATEHGLQRLRDADFNRNVYYFIGQKSLDAIIYFATPLATFFHVQHPRWGPSLHEPDAHALCRRVAGRDGCSQRYEKILPGELFKLSWERIGCCTPTEPQSTSARKRCDGSHSSLLEPIGRRFCEITTRSPMPHCSVKTAELKGKG